MTQEVTTANRAAKEDDFLERLIEAAQEHGQDSDPDHEVGDLQDLLRSLWAAADPKARQAFLAGPAVQTVVETMREERQAKMPFIHGGWTHIFGPGKSEALVRFSLDVRDQKIVAMQIKDGPHDDDWVDADPAQIADVQDSVVNANGECLGAPEDYGLERAYVLPAWVRGAASNEQKQSLETTLFAALRAADLVVCDGYEIDGECYGESGNDVRLDCGDEMIAELTNQVVRIDANGDMVLEGDEGPVELTLSVSRPISAEDIGEVHPSEQVQPDEQVRMVERG